MANFSVAKEVRCGNFVINHVYADISISFHDEDFVAVNFDSHDKPVFIKDGEKTTLEIGLPGVEKRGRYDNVYVYQRKGKREIIEVDDVELDTTKKISISMTLPRCGANIEFEEYIFGSITFTENGDDISVSNSSHTRITAKNFRKLQANLAGHAGMRMEQTRQGLSLNCSGQSWFETIFSSGSTLINASGKASANFTGGITGTLSFTSSGESQIKAARVDVSISGATIGGNSKVDLGNGSISGIESFTVSMDGAFDFAGIATFVASTGRVTLSGQAKVEMAEIKGNLQMSLAGNGNLQAKKVTIDSLNVTVSMSGQCLLENGRIENLRISTSMNGKFHFGGSAGTVSYAQSGNSHIYVEYYEKLAN